jgi:hypothetical protein
MVTILDGLGVRNNSEREPLKDHYSEVWSYFIAQWCEEI